MFNIAAICIYCNKIDKFEFLLESHVMLHNLTWEGSVTVISTESGVCRVEFKWHSQSHCTYPPLIVIAVEI